MDLVRTEILECSTVHEFAISAYVFMPDHVHLLAEGCADACDLRAFVHAAKQRSAYAYSGGTGARLWQPSFHDHVLRDDEPSLPFVRYILENPVRSALVERITEYPYLESGTTTIEEILRALAEAGADAWDTSQTLAAPKGCATGAPLEPRNVS